MKVRFKRENAAENVSKAAIKKNSSVTQGGS